MRKKFSLVSFEFNFDKLELIFLATYAKNNIQKFLLLRISFMQQKKTFVRFARKLESEPRLKLYVKDKIKHCTHFSNLLLFSLIARRKESAEATFS